MRSRTPLRMAAAMVLSAGLGGCAARGAAHEGPGATSPPGRTSLQIVVTPGFLKGAAVHRYRLTCDPVGGTLPDPAAACQALAAAPALLVHDRTCTTPDVGNVRITGEFQGRPVDAWFGMCGADAGAWQRVAAALGIQTG